jgi:membrane protease YdiL (CAAX protease family)
MNVPRGPSDGDASAHVFMLSLLGIAVMSAAFLVRSPDSRTRVVAGIAVLGVVALRGAVKRRADLFRIDAVGVGVGLVSGACLYLAARWMTRIPAIAEQTALVSAWRKGHSVGVIVPTLLLAAAGEELFWRGAIVRGLAARAPKWVAAIVAAAMFSVAHVASGTWLLPGPAAAIVLTWNILFLTTESLVAPLASHLVFDLLAIVIAPLG